MSNVKLPMIFGDHMVLLHGKRVPVWGTAGAGEKIKVSIQGQTACCLADEKGNWNVLLPELEVSFSETMTVESCESRIVYEDVAVGEVWLAGGQSNMEFQMRYDGELKEELAREEEPSIRFFDYPEVSYEEALEEYDFSEFGFWRICTRENLQYYSAVAYYFARDIYASRKIPVGIIGCSWGGTRACCWMPKEEIIKSGGSVWLEEYQQGIEGLDLEKYGRDFRKNPMNDRSHPFEDPFNETVLFGVSRAEQLKMSVPEEAADLCLGPLDGWRPAGLYHTMLKKIIPYGIRGIIYYQGESDDIHADLYKGILEGLIGCWRRQWGEELPFLMVELAPFGWWLGNTGEKFSLIRKAQEETAKEMSKVWVAASGDSGMLYDIHPKRKRKIGERLALLARGHVYQENIKCDAPVFSHGQWKGNTLELCFEHVEEFSVEGDHIRELQVSGRYSLFDQDAYRIRALGDKVLIEFADRPCDDVKIEFAGTPYYQVNLYNEAGIPVKPFETVISVLTEDAAR